ncbi:hypothetical protein WJX81_000914 [Elliptochloris bilobata]|uniref:DUF6851 domain-containing protein n=1 Tax=Elliptochloris bilobata TaxID=381761 RepID=A0AAW1QI67_9CHLO
MGQAFAGVEPDLLCATARPAPNGGRDLEHNEGSRGVAAAYALCKYANFILPRCALASCQERNGWKVQAQKAQFDAIMKQLALPLSDAEDLSTPAGIGNRAGRAAFDRLANDGFNQLGNLGKGFIDGSTAYNYTDYPPLYKPVNTYDVLHNASR